MKKPRKLAKVANRLSAAELFRERVLEANFEPFPGDIGKFDDDALGKAGLLEALRKLEREFAPQETFERLNSAIFAEFPRESRREVYRWLCLIRIQNRLRKTEIESARDEIRAMFNEEKKLRHERSEGTSGLWLRTFAEGADPSDPKVLEEDQRIRVAHRERQAQDDERGRIRSGSAPPYCNKLDWLQPHTEQEYVDAFGEKRIHVKRIRAFLRPFASTGKRRGRGRNRPVEFTVEAGFLLFCEAVSNWITDNNRRVAVLFATAAYQVVLPSALSPRALEFRKILAELFDRFKSKTPGIVLASTIALVGTDENWRSWHEVVRKVGILTQDFSS